MIQCRQFRSEADLVLRVNDLARKFFIYQCGEISDDFKFYDTDNPHAKQMWDLALMAYKQIYCHTDKNGTSYIESSVELGIRQLDYYVSHNIGKDTFT